MKMRKIERCNMIVSEIGLGCEGFHEADMDLYQLLDIAETSGVNCIDLYSPDPIMRKRLGEALKGRREKFIGKNIFYFLVIEVFILCEKKLHNFHYCNTYSYLLGFAVLCLSEPCSHRIA